MVQLSNSQLLALLVLCATSIQALPLCPREGLFSKPEAPCSPVFFVCGPYGPIVVGNCTVGQVFDNNAQRCVPWPALCGPMNNFRPQIANSAVTSPPNRDSASVQNLLTNYGSKCTQLGTHVNPHAPCSPIYFQCVLNERGENRMQILKCNPGNTYNISSNKCKSAPSFCKSSVPTEPAAIRSWVVNDNEFICPRKGKFPAQQCNQYHECKSPKWYNFGVTWRHNLKNCKPNKLFDIARESCEDAYKVSCNNH